MRSPRRRPRASGAVYPKTRVNSWLTRTTRLVLLIKAMACGACSSDKPPPQGGGSDNGLKALFRPEAGKMSPAPSGLQEVDGLNHLLEVLVLVDTLFGDVTDGAPKLFLQVRELVS